jgi:hypothetical protein
MDVQSLLKPMEPLFGESAGLGILFHVIIAIIVLVLVSVWASRLSKTLNAPAPPAGAIGRDYDALASSRQPLSAYMTANGIADSTPMVNFQIATANFGGIFTEKIGYMNPWIGTVSPDAAALQVKAGARAIVFDIWPDPADRTSPVVCAMVDTNQWGIQNWWRNTWGLNKGVGRYSNWQLLTRNKVRAGIMLSAACAAAFDDSNPQKTDPFFLMLRLHGAMTPAYLNTLGTMVQTALGGRALGPNYSNSQQQAQFCKTPVSEFTSPAGGYGIVLVSPDMSPGYNILPGVNTITKFVPAFNATMMGQVTNAIENPTGTMWFDEASIGPLSIDSVANCNGTGTITPPAAGFCTIQPSIGSQSTENPTLFRDNNFQICQQTGAQMVAVNLFSPDPNDAVLNSWFSAQNFGTYSFKKV